MTTNSKRQKIVALLYSFATLVFSLLMIAYAYDISQGNEIDASSTQKGRQDILVSIASFLGLKGSVVLGTLATGTAFYIACMKSKKK